MASEAKIRNTCRNFLGQYVNGRDGWFGLLDIGASIILLLVLAYSSIKARQGKGDKNAAKVVIFPLYFKFLVFFALYRILSAIYSFVKPYETARKFNAGFPGASPSWWDIPDGIIFGGLWSILYLAPPIFLTRKGAGPEDIKRTCYITCAIALVSSIYWWFWSHSSDEVISDYLTVGFDAAYILFYLIVVVIRWSSPRNSVRSLAFYEIIMYGINLFGYLLLGSIGFCMVAIHPVQDICFVIVLYQALRTDSGYWRGRTKESGDRPSPLKDVEQGTILRYSNIERATQSNKVTMIDFAFVDVQDKVAAGGNADVFHGYLYGNEVALKRLRGFDINETMLAECVAEASVLVELKHPRIVTFLGVCAILPHIYLVFEFCHKGSLYRVLHSEDLLTTERRLKYSLHVAEAVSFLHSKAVIHRDLKSLNFLVTFDDDVKLTDFGTSKILKRRLDLRTSKIGTPQWMAPEIMNNQAYTIKADIYSMSLVIWEIFSQSEPYGHLSPLKIPFHVLNNKQRPEIPSDCPLLCAQLLRLGWDEEPEKRPTADEFVLKLRCLIDKNPPFLLGHERNLSVQNED